MAGGAAAQSTADSHAQMPSFMNPMAGFGGFMPGMMMPPTPGTNGVASNGQMDPAQ